MNAHSPVWGNVNIFYANTDNLGMKKRYAFLLSSIVLVALLNGFSADKTNFPAPVKEPAVAVYLNISSSGIYEGEDSTERACEEIAEAVENICRMRNVQIATDSGKYKTICFDLLKESMINGFLHLEELYFYYKNSEEYALIGNGEFNLDMMADKIKGETLCDDDGNVIGLSSVINADSNSSSKAESRLFLQANGTRIVLCPENIAGNIMNSIESEQNLLGEAFTTFGKMIKVRPAIGAEINVEKLVNKVDKSVDLPESVAATNLVRLLVGAKQNKLQINIPKADERSNMKKQLFSQTEALNAIFDNKTDYKLSEGKTSLFIETKADKEQMQTICRKAMAFMLHFFVKNTPSDQKQKEL